MNRYMEWLEYVGSVSRAYAAGQLTEREHCERARVLGWQYPYFMAGNGNDPAEPGR